jgi:hypothetical protein
MPHWESSPRPLQSFADELGLDELPARRRTRTTSAPRWALAWRLGGSQSTVLRGGFGGFHPDRGDPGPARPAGDQPVPLRANLGRRPARPCLLAGRRRPSRSTLLEIDGSIPNIQAPTSYQYNLSLEPGASGDLGLRVSYIGSTMRKLVNNRDFNTIPPSTDFWTQDDPTSPGCRSRLRLLHWTHRQPRRKPAPRSAARAAAPWKDGFAAERGATHSPTSGGHRPRHRLRQPGAGHVRQGRHREGPRPDPSVRQAPSSWRTPPGHPVSATGRKHGSDIAGWADALFGGWTVVHDLPGA